MPKPATFIALTMSINPRKWYLFYLNMLIIFKIVILSVTFSQSITVYKLLRFRLLCQKVTLCLFLTKQNFLLVPIVIRIKVDKCFSLATIRLFSEIAK